MIDRRGVLATLGLLAAAPGARAAGYPDRPIRLVVPFAPGGATDLAARILQPHLSAALGQPLVVENRTGAAGNVGMEAAARAARRTAIPSSSAMSARWRSIPTVFARTLRIKPAEDFAAISLVSETPDALVVHPSAPFGSVREMVAYARPIRAGELRLARRRQPQPAGDGVAARDGRRASTWSMWPIPAAPARR